MSNLEILIVALLLDAFIGDPDALWRRFPHPAELMGRAIEFLDRSLNQGRNRKLKGILSLAVLLLLTWLVGAILAGLPDFGVLEATTGAVLLAQNSLGRHVSAVADGLRQGLPQGRHAVSMIVGRDAQALDKNGVARSAIESAAENFSDGVVAPAFWFLMLGLPGIMVYKMANTADSMIGYNNNRHREFGWAAARFDDLINWIPARLTGVLICLAHGSARAFRVMLRDAPLHRSPNAGWPEAAAAAVISVAISGPRTYDGSLVDYPYVNAEGARDLTPEHITKAVRVNWQSWAVMLAILFAIWLL